jgi:hypothetical protein
MRYLRERGENMDILHAQRGKGKTSYLIERSAYTGEVIVCIGSYNRDHICELAIKNGLDIPYPITYEEFLGKSESEIGRDLENGVIIDEIDLLLKRASAFKNIEIGAATLTHEEEYS